MSLLRRQKRVSGVWGPSPEEMIRRTTSGRGAVAVTEESALRHSAVWACLRLRANLISTMPVDLFQKVRIAPVPAPLVQIEARKPPVFVNPGGERVDILEWMYSTQFDLDRAGNCFGLITAKDGFGLPARIDLQSLSGVSIKVKDGEIFKYRFGSKEYNPDEVWHERQYTVAGLHVGLSPVAYAAWSVGEYLSIQDFALNWFGNGAVPQAILKNTQKAVPPQKAAEAKTRFKAAVEAGDVFVTGNDWEYKMIQADQAGSAWLEAKQYGLGDVARFFDCPGDVIDAAVSGTSITYANIVQRNLQLLIHNLGPAVIRREAALTRIAPKQTFVKLNSDALLRMDPASRAAMFKAQIDARILAPSEARELDNRPPFTESQYGEFDRLFGPPKTSTPTGGSVPSGAAT